MKSWSMIFATQMLFRRSGSELFDTFKNIILLRIFPLWNIYLWKMLRKLKWQIPGERLAVRCNWCQGPVPGRGPGVEKHWVKAPYHLDVRHYKGGRSSAIRTGRLYPRRNPWYSFSETESTSGHMVLSEGSTGKIPNDTTGNRFRDRPSSSAAP